MVWLLAHGSYPAAIRHIIIHNTLIMIPAKLVFRAGHYTGERAYRLQTPQELEQQRAAGAGRGGRGKAVRVARLLHW